MRHRAFLFTTLLSIAFSFGCKDEGAPQTGMTGQVFCICIPVIPIGWTPPPLETVSTIVILDENRLPLKEARTNDKGRFSIPLPAGTYFIRVKESPIPEETGPYNLKFGEMVSVAAHYDSGVR